MIDVNCDVYYQNWPIIGTGIPWWSIENNAYGNKNNATVFEPILDCLGAWNRLQICTKAAPVSKLFSSPSDQRSKFICKTAPKSLLWVPTGVPGFEYTPWFAVKNAIVDCQLGWKEIRNTLLVIDWVCCGPRTRISVFLRRQYLPELNYVFDAWDLQHPSVQALGLPTAPTNFKSCQQPV